MSIRFVTPNGTVAIAEPNNPRVRIREDNELVHYRDSEETPICAACGCIAYVWVGNTATLNEHPARCSTVKED